MRRATRQRRSPGRGVGITSTGASEGHCHPNRHRHHPDHDHLTHPETRRGVNITPPRQMPKDCSPLSLSPSGRRNCDGFAAWWDGMMSL